MLTYKPKRSARTALTVEIILFVILALLAFITSFQTAYRVIGQSLMFAVVAGIVYIAMRYMIYEYTYAVSSDIFEVSRIAGRLPVTLFRIDISKEDTLVKINDKKDLKSFGVQKCENLCLNLSPRDCLYAYITRINGKKTAILIESDELFAFAVNERINMKKLSSDKEETED